MLDSSLQKCSILLQQLILCNYFIAIFKAQRHLILIWRSINCPFRPYFETKKAKCVNRLWSILRHWWKSRTQQKRARLFISVRHAFNLHVFVTEFFLIFRGMFNFVVIIVPMKQKQISWLSFHSGGLRRNQAFVFHLRNVCLAYN